VHPKFDCRNLKESDYSDNLDVDGKVILEWIMGSRMGRCGLDASG